MNKPDRLNVARLLAQALVVFTVFFGWSCAARADCPVTGGMPVFAYGSVAVPVNLSVGEVIPGTIRSFRLSGQCVLAGLFNKDIVACPTKAAVAGLSGVYATGVTGIGMRMRNNAGVALDDTGGCQTQSSLGKTDATGKFDVAGTFELVKTGPVTSATLGSAASYNTGVLNTGYVLNNGASYMYVADGTAVKAVTCSVTAATANQTVSMRTANSSTLAATGAVSGKTPFSIALTCQSGVKVNVTFSSAAGASGVDSVVKSTGTATGIGIQLLDASDAPIALDQAHKVVESTSGNTTIPFFAQYYRLSGGTATGTVQAAATYTMSYQ